MGNNTNLIPIICFLGAGLIIAAGVISKKRRPPTPPTSGAASTGEWSWTACRLAMTLGVAMCGLGLSILALRFWGILLAVAIFAVVKGRHGWRGSGSAFGTAFLGDFPELSAAGMLGDYGLIIGRTLSYGRRGNRKQAVTALIRLPWSKSREAALEFAAAFGRVGYSGQLIRLPRYVHLLTIAPTGAGKGIGFVIPTTLSYLHAMVIHDPKGDIFTLSSAYRKRIGQAIARFDPFGVCGPGGDGFNPLDLIDRDSELLIDYCRALAESLVIRSGNEAEPHWGDKAVAVLTATISFVAATFNDAERHLGSVREIVTDPALFEHAGVQLRAMGGMFARHGNALLHLVDKEFSSVLSTVDRHTSFLDSVPVNRAIQATSFDVRALLADGLTIYWILPAEQMQAQSRLLRLWTTSLIRLVGSVGVKKGAEAMFLIDEAAQIGYLESLEQALTLLRSSGVRLWLFYQSIDQAKKTFKDKENLVFDNSDCQIYFGVNSYETAEKVSKTIGDQTIAVESYNRSTSRSRQQGGRSQEGQTSTSTTNSWQEKERAVFRPDEIIQLPEDAVIILTKGVRPILARRISYYNDPYFVGGSDGGDVLRKAWGVAFFWLLAGAASLAGAVAVLGALDHVR